MGDSDRGEPALRIERGHANDEELAALTVVLIALSGGADADDGDKRPVNGFRWWRGPETYRAPHTWQ